MHTGSFRSQDMRAEQRLGEFMDAYFYSRLRSKSGKRISFTRMTDIESQLKGIDVCIETDGKKMIIDEKASLYYSNVMIPTFAFEIDWVKQERVEPLQGWFVNDELQTEYYMLIWPNIKCTQQEGRWIRKDLADLRKEDFTILEAMMIEKADIKTALERKGFNKGFLIEYARRIRNRNKADALWKEEKLDENIKIMYSGQLAEKPVNLVIRKELLKELAKGIYLISADGYATIKG